MTRAKARVRGAGKALVESGGVTPLFNRLRSFLGPSVIAGWSFGDPVGSTSVRDAIAGYIATPANVTFGAAGIGRKTSASFDGVSSGVNLASAGFNAAYNAGCRTEGYMMCFAKAANLGVWTDGEERFIFQAVNNGAAKPIRIDRADARTIYFYGFGQAPSTPPRLTHVDWMHLCVTWSISNDRLGGFVNGEQRASANTLTTWGADTLSAINAGSYLNLSNFWSGGICDVFIGAGELSPANVLAAASLYRTPIRFTVLGDSISSGNTTWPWLLTAQHNAGYVHCTNRAVSGAHICHTGVATDMEDEATAAAGDNAGLIIIALGTNDGGDINITPTYTAQVNALKASNPYARIFSMGILPKTLDANRAADNARIEAACTAAGIPYWNTDGWIDPAADTSDGTHPTAGGHAKITAQALARLG